MTGVSHAIAVVDDEEAVRRSMERVLRAAGYGVTTFADGADFVESLRSERPACVLLDLVMPRMGGRDVLCHLAGQAVRVPAIVVTGRHAQQARRLATLGAATAYFTKPVDAAALLAEIDATIGGARPDGA